ncbi:hypothetical protein EIP91_000729 [Steccherinum ochraceum]|uniref:Spherulin-4 n=1 Tax=Steccherinum ochraceum TaxID=92696 RepID=A0A4R0RFH0_9APHY|nr:hypothetical protein EIP91_000729 [Steccherinum ochraceum]
MQERHLWFIGKVRILRVLTAEHLERGLGLLASGIIFPLYIFPGDPGICANWTPLFNSISTNPDLQFHVIVNPASGPGTDPQPSTSYQSCVALLKSPNVNVYGYVFTDFGNREEADVIADVDLYAGWGTAYVPDGIFFDQVLGTEDNLDKYTGYAEHTRQSFGGGSGLVTLNPGAEPTTDYFNIVDLIVTSEVFFTDFNTANVTIGPSAPASKQAIILHDAPSTVPTALVDELVGTDKIGALYITDDVQANNMNPYDSFPSDWDAFVSAVVSAQ